MASRIVQPQRSVGSVARSTVVQTQAVVTVAIPRQQRRCSQCTANRRLLFTPGPLTTSDRVKQALLQDVGSRDQIGFLEKMHDVRKRLVKAAHSTNATHDCVIIQGAGTHAIESVLGSVLSGDCHVLILSNGAYGERQKKICKVLGISFESIDYGDDCAINPEDVAKRLSLPDANAFTHISMVHHETTAGVLNDLTGVCDIIKSKRPDLDLILDSMSAFGAYDVNLSEKHSAVKYLISSANKCMEGVPGFSYCIYNKASLAKLDTPNYQPKSLCLDLLEQAKGLSSGNGQFRFTPPTQPILAYQQALIEWEDEGGSKARLGRYEANYQVIEKWVNQNNLKFYVKDADRGCIITTILSPTENPNWDFNKLYDFLAERGFVIYPGKLSKAESFRLGTIGKIYPSDCENLVLLLNEGFRQMGVQLPLKDGDYTKQ